ncbi:MAG: NADH-quinone oxidoreductase subunit L [Gammaproteobacteria bacterium]|nr:NADH-quinone oxidoreductase subunit L [Gammaproteobacteria bacterium]
MQAVYLAAPLVCLAASIAAGVFGRVIGRAGAHWVTILGVAAAFGLSVVVYIDVIMNGNHFNGVVYTWGVSGGLPLEIGFLIDELTAMMMVVVTFVSFMVHVYTVGYMREDPGYQRFFSYISLFTFAMLMLVMSNNFLQLFFGWEAVGVVSYLLIGFWYKKDTATHASLKAFLVNRVGDFGFLLGIAAIAYLFGSLDYAAVFASAPQAQDMTVSVLGGEMGWITVICLLLFVGAMGKSAQVPLHVWLPDSMEGPTPISALIHAATMVTAGIFMVARMSPLFELSVTALSVVMIIGALTAFLMALVGMVQNDIKRVVAYSTLSQLGYMTVALGASAYAAGIFHLGTHAFFKALLFLAAGSVIIALHHEQDMRKMGGLRKAMPITFITAWVGTLALIGLPPFSGFFSKDSIIEAVHTSELAPAGFAYLALIAGTFVTSFYSFRLLFLTFHGKPRMSREAFAHAKESPWVVTVPLVLLAIPSIGIGALYFEPMLFGNFFGDSIYVLPENDTLSVLAASHRGAHGEELIWQTMSHGITAPPVILTVAGFVVAWVFYIKNPELPKRLATTFNAVHYALMNKYGFDEFNDFVFARGARRIGGVFWKTADAFFIDGLLVNGTARTVGWLSGVVRQIQSGYMYHYAFAMIIGLFVLISWYLSTS